MPLACHLQGILPIRDTKNSSNKEHTNQCSNSRRVWMKDFLVNGKMDMKPLRSANTTQRWQTAEVMNVITKMKRRDSNRVIGKRYSNWVPVNDYQFMNLPEVHWGMEWWKSHLQGFFKIESHQPQKVLQPSTSHIYVHSYCLMNSSDLFGWLHWMNQQDWKFLQRPSQHRQLLVADQ